MSAGASERQARRGDAAILARLRELIAGGALPPEPPTTVVASKSTDHGRCTACGLSFKPDDLEYEMNTAHRIVVSFHRRCFDLWSKHVLGSAPSAADWDSAAS